MLLRQIRCFLAVARTSSFTAAAKTLNLAQPSLGSHVRHLEARYGVALFRRTARGATLTPAGQVFLAHAERILREVELAERALAGLRPDPHPTLRLGVTPTSEVTLLPDLLQRCAAQTPPIRLALQQGHSEELIRDVAGGALDAALCYDIGTPAGVKGTPLYSEDLFLVGPPDAAICGAQVAFRRLADVPLVLDRRFHAIRLRIESTALSLGVRLDVPQEIEPADIKRALIRQHGCFTVVPFGLFADDVRQGRMAAARIVEPTLTRTLHLAMAQAAAAEPAHTIGRWLADGVAAIVRSNELGWRPPDPAEGKAYRSRPKSILGKAVEGR